MFGLDLSCGRTFYAGIVKLIHTFYNFITPLIRLVKIRGEAIEKIEFV